MVWHSDDKPLFGECGDPKRVVSVSFGTAALLTRNAKPCSDGTSGSCWLHHGELLVTFRWIKQHGATYPC